jgi:hypothetical protein
LLAAVAVVMVAVVQVDTAQAQEHQAVAQLPRQFLLLQSRLTIP